MTSTYTKKMMKRANESEEQRVSRLVKEQLLSSKNVEIKHDITTYSNVAMVYPATGAPPSFYDLTLVIPQGTGSQSRIGEVVTRRKYTVNINMWVPYNYTCGPATFKFVFCKLRGNPNSIPTTAQMLALKRTNVATVSSGIYSTNKSTQMTPYNTDLWLVLKTIDVKVGSCAAVAAAPFSVWNNDYAAEASISVDVTNMIKQTVRFDDSSSGSNRQVNDGLFMLGYLLDCQQAVPTASSTTMQADIVCTCEFTDA